jgi:hypothetical protein
MPDRRTRIHALVLALLSGQEELGLLEEDHAIRLNHGRETGGQGGWLERNQRLVRRYQALVRTAITIDALIEQEIGLDQLEPNPAATSNQREGLEGRAAEPWGDPASIRARKSRKNG